MKKSKLKTYALWILLSEAVGALAGWLIRDGVRIYQETVRQPPLSPPAVVFPIVWCILYALMGIGAARADLSFPSGERLRSLRLFILQLALNFCWSLLFFNLRAFGPAFLLLTALWGSILAMVLSLHRTDKTASHLQLPYLLWVSFAGYLNFGVWLLNR